MVGERLQAARMAQGLELESVAEATKLRPSLIAAIEAGDFDVIGGDAYVRGHLRAIASVIGLDPEEIVEQYVRENPGEPHVP